MGGLLGLFLYFSIMINATNCGLGSKMTPSVPSILNIDHSQKRLRIRKISFLFGFENCLYI